MNKVILLGTVSREPEIIEINENAKVAKLSVVTQERFKNKDTDKYENRPTFVEVDAWNGLATFVQNNFGKGKAIIVEGKLFNDNYEDKETGKKVYRMRVRADKINFVPRDSQNASNGDVPSDNSPAANDDIPF